MCAKRGEQRRVCGGARAAAPNAISASILRFVLHPTSSVAPLKPLASRTDALRQSDIRAVTFAVNAAGGINLGQGICDLPTPDPIKAGAKAAIDGDKSIYTSYAGIEKLRAGILQKAQTFNRLPAESTDEVMVSVGS